MWAYCISLVVLEIYSSFARCEEGRSGTRGMLRKKRAGWNKIMKWDLAFRSSPDPWHHPCIHKECLVPPLKHL